MATRAIAHFRVVAPAPVLYLALLVAGCSESRELRQSYASDCSGCHGNAARPVSVQVTPQDVLNDVLLRAAPPYDVQGDVSPAFRGVGAHVAHVKASPNHAPIACVDCHSGVDSSVVQDKFAIYDYTMAHIDGVTKLTFSDVATSNSASPIFDPNALTCAGSWCHGPSSPKASISPTWTSTTGSLDCTGCHGAPPPPPHVQVTQCSTCHGAVVGGADGCTIINPSLHINGIVDVRSTSCNGGCHGSAQSSAPPLDLAGNTDGTFRGVGAHQAHLGTTLARPVQCNDCHIVPATVDAPGHIDATPGAEVTFSSLASSGTLAPAWNGASCGNVYCHNPANAAQLNTGGSLTSPQWTGAGQATCGSCHGLPPPDPHPAVTGGCSGCHSNVTDSLGFIDATKHINGVVDF